MTPREEIFIKALEKIKHTTKMIYATPLKQAWGMK